MSLLPNACLVGATACAACTLASTSHHCLFDVPSCDQTLITLQSPHNAWAPGSYKLTLNGGECSLKIPAPPPTGDLEGTCLSADTRFTLTQLCSPPPMVCNNTACSVTEPNTNCLPGQFQIDVVSPLLTQVGLDLEVDGRTLMNETITPTAATTEPNGAGCGMCTNASATVSIAGN
jgi:hypothetical protein